MVTKTLRQVVDTSGVESFTWVHWKVLELSFDETPLPDLVLEHEYHGFTHGPSSIAASSAVETRIAVRDLLLVGAVSVVREGQTIPPEVALSLIDQPELWDSDSADANRYAVVDEPLGGELLANRPAEADPHG